MEIIRATLCKTSVFFLGASLCIVGCGSDSGSGDSASSPAPGTTSSTASEAPSSPSTPAPATSADLVSQTESEGNVHWRGEITMIHRETEGPYSVGEVVGTYQLRIDWKESHRIEVKNEEGKLTGVLVILADHNSRWSGDVAGVIQFPCARRIYEGTGRGTETLEYGWIYFSLSDDDPMLDVMPHGTYHINGRHTERPSGPVTYMSGLCSTPYTSTQVRNLWGLVLLDIGRELWRPLPCTTPATCRSATFQPSALPASAPWIPAEALKARLEQEFILFNDNIGGIWIDPEPRVVTDNRMRGQYVANVLGTERAGSLSVELTWNLEREVVTRVILDLADKEWLPDGSPSGDAAPLEITARIQERPEATTEGKFRFTLDEVTREPGYALNAGEKDDISPDLEFAADQPGFTAPMPTGTSEAWEIETTELVNETTVMIRARDYGAWAKLRCEVNIDGVWHKCETERGKDYITIPHDTDEDRIADLWEDEYGVRDQDEVADLDSKPEDQRSAGDGISLYEEYRGFVNVDGEHQRLHPDIKTLFVRDQDGLVASSTFESGSGLTVFFLGETGWTGPDDGWDTLDISKRIVNPNTSGYGHETDQHALHVVQDQLFGNNRAKYKEGLPSEYYNERLMGMCPVFGDLRDASPVACPKALVFTDNIATKANEVTANATPEARAEFVLRYQAETAAHEMGHNIGVLHHRMYSADGLHSEEAGGDVRCFMRYNSGFDQFHGIAPWADIFTKLPHCGGSSDASIPNESCWGQIQVSDADTDTY